MATIKVALEFDEKELGEKWMNPDNLEYLLYTEAYTNHKLLKVITYQEIKPDPDSSQLEPLVMQKIVEVIENKKQKIDESLQDYLSTALNMSKEREGQLKLIASCERAILTEVLADIKSNLSV